MKLQDEDDKEKMLGRRIVAMLQNHGVSFAKKKCHASTFYTTPLQTGGGTLPHPAQEQGH
jgi:hypothetical protein